MAPDRPASKPADDAGAETPRLTDSLVTVRLSEPPSLTLDTTLANDESPEAPEASVAKDAEATDEIRTPLESVAEAEADIPAESRNPQNELADTDAADRRSGSSSDDQGPDEVDWEQLEKTEDAQTKDEETDNVGAPRYRAHHPLNPFY